MIIKLPVYVEIDRIDTDCLQPFAELLKEEIYQHLRKKSFKLFLKEQINKDEIIVKDLKIIDADTALESLRKKK